MSHSLPIPVSPSNGSRRSSYAGLASSLALSFTNPSPLAQEAVLRDVADLDASELEADDLTVASGFGSSGRLADLEAYDTEPDTDGPGATATPCLYRRPSGIAYSTSRPAVGLAPPIIEGPPLSRLERKQSRDAERSLLRDNHLLPPKHVVAAVAAAAAAGDTSPAAIEARLPPEPGFLGRLYKRMFSTRVPRHKTDEEQVPTSSDGTETSTSTAVTVTERTALLPPLEPSSSDEGLDDQWEAAVEAGQIHTTWQREAKTIAIYSRSLIVTFLLQYSINITSIFAVGHIGKAELGAVSLATMTASITFYSPVQGLATCLDTLCAQAYGSGHRTLVGLQLQRMCCFLLFILVPVEYIWLHAESILAHLIPDPATAHLAGRYLHVLAYSMPASAVFECSKRYMMAQGLFAANTYVLLIAAPFNVLMNWYLVWHLEMGFVGAPLSSAITQWLMPILLLLYIVFIDGAQCWGGFSKRVFSNWGPMIRLALPGMIMVEAEYFAFEILTLASGQFGTTELAAQSILVTLTSTTYQLPFPVAIAASTRMANLIGAKLPEAAKTCARVAIVAGGIIGLFNVAMVAGFRNQIPSLFTNDPDVRAAVIGAIPICAFMQIFDGLSAIANGMLRGVGRQEIGGYSSLASYYLVGLPLSFYTAFHLGWGLPGLWTGVTLGLALTSGAEFFYLSRYDWRRAVAEAEHRNASG